MYHGQWYINKMVDGWELDDRPWAMHSNLLIYEYVTIYVSQYQFIMNIILMLYGMEINIAVSQQHITWTLLRKIYLCVYVCLKIVTGKIIIFVLMDILYIYIKKVTAFFVTIEVKIWDNHYIETCCTRNNNIPVHLTQLCKVPWVYRFNFQADNTFKIWKFWNLINYN